MLLLTVLGAWLLADFFTGCVHWAEDKFLSSPQKLKFLEGVRDDNDLHHAKPARLTTYTYWGNINTTVPLTVPAIILGLLLHAPLILILAFFFATFANLIHRWAHENPKKVPYWVLLMQKTGLFITLRHHMKHHMAKGKLILKENTSQKWCAMTCWVNPILDLIGFFNFLEKAIRLVLG